MDYQLLIGNPILRRYPKLLCKILKIKDHHPENINSVKQKSAGNRGNSRTYNLSLAPTNPDAIDPKSAGNRGDPRTKPMSFVPTTPDAIDPLTTPENPGSTNSTFTQFQIPEEATILDEDERYFNVVSTIQNVEPKATSHSNRETFSTLPIWLQQKYKGIIRNDLPPRFTDIKDAPVKFDIEIKPDARLPRLQPYHVTQKNEQEINKIVQELLKNKFIVPSESPCSSPVALPETPVHNPEDQRKSSRKRFLIAVISRLRFHDLDG